MLLLGLVLGALVIALIIIGQKLAQKMAAQPRAALQGTRRLLEHLLREGPTLSEAQAAELLALRLDSWQSPEARAASGITEGLLRIAVGLEDLEDLQDDLLRGLQA